MSTFKMAAVRRLGIEKLKFLTANHFTFCGEQSNCCRDITFVRFFQVKCKRSITDDT